MPLSLYRLWGAAGWLCLTVCFTYATYVAIYLLKHTCVPAPIGTQFAILLLLPAVRSLPHKLQWQQCHCCCMFQQPGGEHMYG